MRLTLLPPSHSCLALLALALTALSFGCSEEPLAPDASGAPVVESDSALVEVLAAAYRQRDAATMEALLADRDGAEFLFFGQMVGRGDMTWGTERERRIHRRMFDPGHVPPEEPPVPEERRVQGIELTLRRLFPFEERPHLYADTVSGRSGLDRSRWRVTAATYRVSMQVHVPALSFYPTFGSVTFFVVEDRERPPGTPGKFLLYRWEDQTPDSELQTAGGIETAGHSWTRIKETYAGSVGLDSGPALVDSLARAYRERDPRALARLLAAGEAAPYRFDLAVPGFDGRTTWDAATELLAHERMFEPRRAPPSGVPSRLWVRQLSIDLRPLTGFVERASLYEQIDPGRWRLTQADYSAHVEVVTEDTTRINVSGQARFTVLEDRGLPLGSAGKFQLLRWEDGPAGASGAHSAQGFSERLSWSELKDLYLPLPSINAEATLLRFLSKAYHEADYAAMVGLLSFAPGLDYRFVRDRPDPLTSETAWDAREDLRILARMLRPNLATPAVPEELRLRHADVKFSAQSPFSECFDLYRSPEHPEGIDPARWRVTAAVHASEAVLQFSSSWLRIVGEPVRFVVLQDLDKTPGSFGRFTLYRWESTPNESSSPPGQISWTNLRLLYR